MTKYLMIFLTMGLVLGCSSRALAQGQAQSDLSKAEDSLGHVLSDLKQSSSRLAADNERLTVSNSALKEQIHQLQLQLGQLQQQQQSLDHSRRQLKKTNPRRAAQITDLKQKSLDLGNRLQQAEDEEKSLRQGLEGERRQGQSLQVQIKQMQQTMPPNPSQVQERAALQKRKEELQLMKMIYESQQKQGQIEKKILDYQKKQPITPQADALARQSLLKQQIKQLKAQLIATPLPIATSTPFQTQWDEDQLKQLQAELGALAKNYHELQDLWGRMGQKVRQADMSPAQAAEQSKLQTSINTLKHEGSGLETDLNELRSQMVDLDKRKTQLEIMIQQP